MSKKNLKRNEEITKALKTIAEEKNVSIENVYEAFKESLVAAARKALNLHKNIEVDVDAETSDIQVLLRVEVVEDFPDYDTALSAVEVQKMDESYMLVQEAREFTPDAEAGYMLEVALPFEKFGHLAIAEAKHRLKHNMNTAERNRVFEIYKNKIGTMIIGDIKYIERNGAVVSIGSKTDAMLPNSERMSKDRWKQGQSVKAVISGISEPSKGVGAQVLLSRISKDFVRELFRHEIPEVYDGTIEIKGIARMPGYRSKVAVYSRDDRVDPSGACIGIKGQRIQAVIRELNNERIDVVHWDADPETYLRRALASAGNINIIKIYDVPGTNATNAVVIVGDEDVGLVIGDKGQSIRLTAQLLGREISIYGETDWSKRSDEEKETLLKGKEVSRSKESFVPKKATSLDSIFRVETEVEEKTIPEEENVTNE